MLATSQQDWKAQVLQRDNFVCKRCGSKVNLEAHHKKSRIYFPELSLEVENGETLCELCHKLEPRTIGLFRPVKPDSWHPDGWFYRRKGIQPQGVSVIEK